MSDELNIAVNIFFLVLCADSFRQHFIVKDGIARIMFLWGCGFLIAFLVVRLTMFSLLAFGVIDELTVTNVIQHNIFFIYALIAGQQIIQRRK